MAQITHLHLRSHMRASLRLLHHFQTMLGQGIRMAYLPWWGRIGGGSLLLLAGSILVQTGGGFPPTVWRVIGADLLGDGQLSSLALEVEVIKAFLFLLAWALLLLIALHLVRPGKIDLSSSVAVESASEHSVVVQREEPPPPMQRQALHPGYDTMIKATSGPGNPFVTTTSAPALSQRIHPPLVTTDFGKQTSTLGAMALLVASSRQVAPVTPFTMGKHRFAFLTNGETRHNVEVEGAMLGHPGGGENTTREDATIVVSGTYSSITPFCLLIVADGTVDGPNQQTASYFCAATACNYILSALAEDPMQDMTGIAEMVKKAMLYTNNALYRANRHATEQSAAMTILLLLDDALCVVSVGQSRAYLYRPQRGFVQMTRERASHTTTGSEWQTAREELGITSIISVTQRLLRLQAEDILLLCSDGLWQQVSQSALEETIVASVGKQSVDSLATTLSRALLQSALDAQAHDHISLTVAHVQ